MTETHPYLATLEARFKGVLKHGSHAPDGQACALEVAAIARGIDWTDNPALVGLPDLRPLNDAGWSSDEVRSKHLVPVVCAYWDWPLWSEARKREIMKKVAELTIRRILPVALRAYKLEAEAKRCEEEGTWSAAESAAETAESAAESAAWSAESAAWSAASAAESAAETAESAAKDAVLAESCKVWLDALEAK